MKETDIMREIQIAVSSDGCRLFRNNVGMGLIGKVNPKPVRFGLCVGSSDLIGWTPVVVTQEMVGKKVAIFSAVEVKKPHGHVTEEQMSFISAVKMDGGFAGIAHDTNEAKLVLRGF